MRIILHIGAPKCATSTLQAAFVLNRKAMQAQCGIWYPTDPYEHRLGKGRALSGNAIDLAAHLQPRVSRSRIANRLASWTPDKMYGDIADAKEAGCTTLLYSSEYLAAPQVERVADFVARCRAGDARIEVLYFVRTIVDHAISSFNQHSRQGRYDGTIEDFIANRYRPRFLRDLSVWQPIVDDINVINLSVLKRDVLATALSLIGHDVEELTPTEAANVSERRENLPMLTEETLALWQTAARRLNDRFAPKNAALQAL